MQSAFLIDSIQTALAFLERQYDNHLEIGVFSPFIVNVIIDMIWLRSTVLLIVLFVLFLFTFLSFLISFGLIEYYLVSHFYMLSGILVMPLFYFLVVASGIKIFIPN